MDDLDRMLEFSALPTPPRLTEAELQELDADRKNRLALMLGAVTAALYMLAMAAAGVYVLIEFPPAAGCLLLLAFSWLTLCSLALCVLILLPDRMAWVRTLMGG